jgi:hypothetical protein
MASIDPQVTESSENFGMYDEEVMNMLWVKPVQREQK